MNTPTPTNTNTTQNKKRKETPDGGVASDKDERILKLESELQNKDNEELKEQIKKLTLIVEELKSKQDTEEDEDDLSDEDVELVSSDPWHSKLIELREFRIINGHCNVPRSVSSLGIWVNNQRMNHRKGKLTQEKILLLESLRFSWGKNCPQQPMAFEEGVAELAKYKAAMGHCNIHVDSKSPSRLATTASVYHMFPRGAVQLFNGVITKPKLNCR